MFLGCLCDMLQSTSSLESFFLAMTLYPEVYEKARAAIDEVVGTDRLVDIADRESIPYIACVLKEVLRYATQGFHYPVRGSLIDRLFRKVGCSRAIRCAWQLFHNRNPSEAKRGLGVPHCLMQDDSYGGYFLPKNSTVFYNVW
jgi:hypothetical protein